MLLPLRSGWSPHLLPATAAVLTAVAWLACLEVRADARLRRFAPALASLNLPEATRGVVLQECVFARPDCLPIYGSSELNVDQPTRADRFFCRQRQGFDAFVFGQPGDRCLIMAQELASLGEAARGRKVAVFLSPVWFLPAPEAERRDHGAHKQFAAVFSVQHAGRLAVEGSLAPALKQRFAARLLDYDAIIRAQSPLLALALEELRDGTWPRRCLFAMLRPLVELQNQTLVWQERQHWVEVSRDAAVMRRPRERYSPRGKHPDWSRIERDVDHMQTKRDLSAASRGPAGSDFSLALADTESDRPPEDRDAEFLRRMHASPEWGDLALLLGVARQVGVHLLLIGQPVNGSLSDDRGITPEARRQYYRRLSQTAAAYRTPLRDFSAFEEDRAFFMDVVHPSAEAWVHYDEVLAQFFRPAGR